MFEQLTPGVWIAIAVALVILAALVYKKTSKKTYGDIDLPIPSTRRDDLLYGYYSSLARTYDQVKDHVNLFWYTHFFGVDQFIEILKETHCKVVVDLAPYVFEGKGKRGCTYREGAENGLRGFFDQLQRAGVLAKITYLTPIDEPNLSVKNNEELMKAIRTIRSVVAEYPELAHVKLSVIYMNGGDWMCIEEFDVVGVDHYRQRSQSLTIGDHASLVKSMRPHQKTFIVPGPSFGHEPDPWVAYALMNPTEVEAVIPFIWFDDPNHKDVPYTGLEAMPVEFTEKWINAGKICLNVAGH